MSDERDVCYHRHLSVGPDLNGPTVAGLPTQTKVICTDCGASVTCAYGYSATIPPLPRPKVLYLHDSKRNSVVA